MTQKANLRVCARCEWIFKQSEHNTCPKCYFAHYGARYVYGDKCYKFAKTQEPWAGRKMSSYRQELLKEIHESSIPTTTLASTDHPR